VRAQKPLRSVRHEDIANFGPSKRNFVINSGNLSHPTVDTFLTDEVCVAASVFVCACTFACVDLAQGNAIADLLHEYARLRQLQRAQAIPAIKTTLLS
jgi:hypothetical protein